MDKELIIEQWMNCWEKKKFPIRVDTYQDWRNFRDFWIENPLPDINKVVILYNNEKLINN